MFASMLPGLSDATGMARPSGREGGEGVQIPPADDKRAADLLRRELSRPDELADAVPRDAEQLGRRARPNEITRLTHAARAR
jgi:hypothetical protein